MKTRDVASTYFGIPLPVEPDTVGSSGDDALAPRDGGRFATVSRILRGVGALVILAAAGAFLLQSWSRGDDLLRYGALGALTLVLGGAGFACGAWGESKGARTLFLVMLAMLPVHAGVLGGLIYSQVSWDGSVTTSLPAFGVWTAPSAGVAVLVSAGALTVLAGLAWLAARALVPGQARVVTVALMSLHGALLVPLRDSAWVGGLLAVSVAAAFAFEIRQAPRVPSLQTFEGRVVRLLLFVPSLMLFARPHLHGFPPESLNGVALLVAGVALFLYAQSRGGGNPFLIATSLVALTSGWLGLVEPVFGWPSAAELVLPLAVLLGVLSRWAARGGSVYRQVAAGLAAAGALIELWSAPGLASAGLALTIGIATLAFGVQARQILVALFGLVAAASGLVYQLVLAIEHFSWNRWGTLALVGLLTILTAAILERKQDSVLRWSKRLRSGLTHWHM